jgi:hypothetical protein
MSTDEPIPPMVLQILEQMGVDPNAISFAVQTAQQQDPRFPEEQGPNAQQVEQAMAPQPQEAPA